MIVAGSLGCRDFARAWVQGKLRGMTRQGAASPAAITQPGRVQSIRLLGARIDCVRLDELLSAVCAAARSRDPLTIMYVNVHCMNVRAADEEYAAILERSDIVYCDGTGVRLAAWLARESIPQRMTGADWIHDLCSRAVRDNLSLFLLGGRAGAAEDAAGVLVSRYPGLRIAGTHSGFGAGAEAIAAVNRSRADILLVGMGTPTQEKWNDHHRAGIQVPVVWAVGALFDFVSGRIPRGPRWMTENGLEWACRLVVEPRKLWRRYLIGNPLFFARVVHRYWLPR